MDKLIEEIVLVPMLRVGMQPGASRQFIQVQNCADGTGAKRRKLHDHAKHGHENVGLNVVILRYLSKPVDVVNLSKQTKFTWMVEERAVKIYG